MVYICEEKKTHKIYAVKSMALDDEHLYFLKDNFLLLRNIQHSNIIEYQSLYFDHVKNISYLVMEYFPHASLIAHAETLQED